MEEEAAAVEAVVEGDPADEAAVEGAPAEEGTGHEALVSEGNPTEEAPEGTTAVPPAPLPPLPSTLEVIEVPDDVVKVEVKENDSLISGMCPAVETSPPPESCRLSELCFMELCFLCPLLCSCIYQLRSWAYYLP